MLFLPFFFKRSLAFLIFSKRNYFFENMKCCPTKNLHKPVLQHYQWHFSKTPQGFAKEDINMLPFADSKYSCR